MNTLLNTPSGTIVMIVSFLLSKRTPMDTRQKTRSASSVMPMRKCTGTICKGRLSAPAMEKKFPSVRRKMRAYRPIPPRHRQRSQTMWESTLATRTQRSSTCPPARICRQKRTGFSSTPGRKLSMLDLTRAVTATHRMKIMNVVLHRYQGKRDY